MIQIITGDYQTKLKYHKDSKYCVSDFRTPKAFDEFEINIVDLGFSELWENKENSVENIKMIKDLFHYKNIIQNTSKAKIVVVLPQNIYFRYDYYRDKYLHVESLKNLLKLIRRLLIENICNYSFQLEFATTQTTLNKVAVTADFYFSDDFIENKDVILTSDKSNKTTGVKINKQLYYTTLNICDKKEILEEFLYKTKILGKNVKDIPEWLDEINILEDKKIRENIQQIEKEIVEKEQNKQEELKKLQGNNKIKSILYETDEELQREVISILNELLDYKDDNFVDEKEEDFRIIKENITFIVETKGLSRNIKGTDIDKTFNHVLTYEEKLEQEDKHENVKGIFIVATQRERKPQERDKTPDRQLMIAKKLNILIIKTEELLKIFEDYRKKRINTDEIMKLFSEQIGELEYKKE